MRPARSIGEVFTFGGRVPAAVGGLITAIVALSLLGALGRSLDLVEVAALVPALVFEGQLWRLFTWVVFEAEPFSLIFGALTLFWFGRDLCFAWGPRRFLATFFGVAAATGVVTCLVGRFVLPALYGMAFVGSWPVLLAFLVAWAMIFPERQMLYMMVLPITGRALLWITLGGTLLYAAFGGVIRYIPHLAAQLIMMGYARGWSLRGFWQSWRIRQYERRARRRASHLKVVKKDPPRWLN
ncbi:MAG TPA: rhomboid family intramembrane serine protease [Anaeromyxobacteraceae bacterium]|nr:rhomboid family intramembrane serine protease [Anaeromyxobacteraceae bacterium]